MIAQASKEIEFAILRHKLFSMNNLRNSKCDQYHPHMGTVPNAEQYCHPNNYLQLAGIRQITQFSQIHNSSELPISTP